ncbi:MAG: OB-fold domain-containing protein [Ilumatobacteraceae bacterium]|nr:OB-fold domain-containing protein [Ilumatobacteraceae bacterium]
MTMLPTDPRLFRLPEGDEARPHLLGSYAPESELYFWPRRQRCPVTRTAVEDVDLTSEGVLYAWTFLHVPRMGKISYGDAGGYGVGQIDLAEGVRIQAPLLGTTDDWQIGSKMGLTTFPVGEDDDGNEMVTFRFEAIS